MANNIERIKNNMCTTHCDHHRGNLSPIGLKILDIQDKQHTSSHSQSDKQESNKQDMCGVIKIHPHYFDLVKSLTHKDSIKKDIMNIPLPDRFDSIKEKLSADLKIFPVKPKPLNLKTDLQSQSDHHVMYSNNQSDKDRQKTPQDIDTEVHQGSQVQVVLSNQCYLYVQKSDENNKNANGTITEIYVAHDRKFYLDHTTSTSIYEHIADYISIPYNTNEDHLHFRMKLFYSQFLLTIDQVEQAFKHHKNAYKDITTELDIQVFKVAGSSHEGSIIISHTGSGENFNYNNSLLELSDDHNITHDYYICLYTPLLELGHIISRYREQYMFNLSLQDPIMQRYRQENIYQQFDKARLTSILHSSDTYILGLKSDDNTSQEYMEQKMLEEAKANQDIVKEALKDLDNSCMELIGKLSQTNSLPQNVTNFYKSHYPLLYNTTLLRDVAPHYYSTYNHNRTSDIVIIPYLTNFLKILFPCNFSCSEYNKEKPSCNRQISETCISTLLKDYSNIFKKYHGLDSQTHEKEIINLFNRVFSNRYSDKYLNINKDKIIELFQDPHKNKKDLIALSKDPFASKDPKLNDNQFVASISANPYLNSYDIFYIAIHSNILPTYTPSDVLEGYVDNINVLGVINYKKKYNHGLNALYQLAFDPKRKVETKGKSETKKLIDELNDTFTFSKQLNQSPSSILEYAVSFVQNLTSEGFQGDKNLATLVLPKNHHANHKPYKNSLCNYVSILSTYYNLFNNLTQIEEKNNHFSLTNDSILKPLQFLLEVPFEFGLKSYEQTQNVNLNISLHEVLSYFYLSSYYLCQFYSNRDSIAIFKTIKDQKEKIPKSVQERIANVTNKFLNGNMFVGVPSNPKAIDLMFHWAMLYENVHYVYSPVMTTAEQILSVLKSFNKIVAGINAILTITTNGHDLKSNHGIDFIVNLMSISSSIKPALKLMKAPVVSLLLEKAVVKILFTSCDVAFIAATMVQNLRDLFTSDNQKDILVLTVSVMIEIYLLIFAIFTGVGIPMLIMGLIILVQYLYFYKKTQTSFERWLSKTIWGRIDLDKFKNLSYKENRMYYIMATDECKTNFYAHDFLTYYTNEFNKNFKKKTISKKDDTIKKLRHANQQIIAKIAEITKGTEGTESTGTTTYAPEYVDNNLLNNSISKHRSEQRQCKVFLKNYNDLKSTTSPIKNTPFVVHDIMTMDFVELLRCSKPKYFFTGGTIHADDYCIITLDSSELQPNLNDIIIKIITTDDQNNFKDILKHKLSYSKDHKYLYCEFTYTNVEISHVLVINKAPAITTLKNAPDQYVYTIFKIDYWHSDDNMFSLFDHKHYPVLSFRGDLEVVSISELSKKAMNMTMKYFNEFIYDNQNLKEIFKQKNKKTKTPKTSQNSTTKGSKLICTK